MGHCEDISSTVSQGSGSGTVNIFIDDLDDRIESTFIKFADDTKLGRVASTLEGRISTQIDLDKLENWSEMNKIEFNRAKCKVPHLERQQSNAQILHVE